MRKPVSSCVKAYSIPFLLFFLLSVGGARFTECVAQSYPVSVLNVNNGLRSGTVECGLYDSRGFIWLGTREGLHRYDGKNVVRYIPDITDPSAIQSTLVQALAEDHLGHIWLVGDKGVEIFLPEENCFEHLKSWSYDSYVSIRILDSLDIGLLYGYFGTGTSIVISLSQRRFLDPDTELTPGQSKALNESWLVKDKINYFNSKSRPAAYDFIKYIAGQKDHVFWINDNVHEINISTNKKGGYTRFIHGKPIPEWQPVDHHWTNVEANGRMAVLDYNDSLVIAGMAKSGIVLIQKKSGKVLRKWTFSNYPELERNTSIDFLMKDPSGRVWFSIMPYGVFVLHPLSPRFQMLKNTTPNSILHNNMIRSLHCDASGHLWIGYHDGHVQVLDSNLDSEVDIVKLPRDQFMLDRQIASIEGLPNGRQVINSVFSASLDQGSIHFRKIPLKDHVHYQNYNHCRGVPDRYLIHHGDPLGEIIAFDASGKRTFPVPSGIIYPPSFYVLGNEVAFFSGPQNYIGLLDFSHGEKPHVIQSRWIDHNVVGAYQKKNSDTLWLACRQGLAFLNISTFEFQEIDTRHWPSNYLYGILPDEKGNLWISTNAGLVRYHPKTKATRFIDVAEGLQSNEFNTNCYTPMKDGSLAFAGPEGLNVFHPDYFEDKEDHFWVYPVAIKVDDKEQPFVKALNTHLSLTLKPYEKTLEIHYGSTKHLQRSGLKYFVKLDGADPDWVNQENHEFIRYINLKPGKYQLRIKAYDGYGNWSRNEITGMIVMQPAFHQTVWFHVLWIALLSFLAWAFYQYRIRQLKRIMAIRNRISRDLHDDIGSTLGSISIYSEVAKNSKSEDRMAVLDKIGVASREMIEKLNDIVWSINPENDSLEKMEKRMRSYAALLLNPLGIGFDLQMITDDNQTRFDMDKRKDIFLIYKEALHNAAKYAECGFIRIKIEETHGQFRMEIQDDGIGFDQRSTNPYNGNGLDSMRARAQAIGVRMAIESEPGKGTKIVLS